MCRINHVIRAEFIFSRIKKDEDQGKEKCHAKSMMSKETNERLKRDTQHVPFRQNAEEIFVSIRPTTPFKLAKHEARRKRNWSDSSGNSLVKADVSR